MFSIWRLNNLDTNTESDKYSSKEKYFAWRMTNRPVKLLDLKWYSCKWDSDKRDQGLQQIGFSFITVTTTWRVLNYVIKMHVGGRVMTQSRKYLPCKYEDLVQIPSTYIMANYRREKLMDLLHSLASQTSTTGKLQLQSKAQVQKLSWRLIKEVIRYFPLSLALTQTGGGGEGERGER